MAVRQFGNKFFLTTAINYTNGPPHMGHAYEIVIADTFARYHRVFGRKVFFLTGTDEHGQKIAQTAEAQNKKPIELCDYYVNKFQDLNKSLRISNDFYIRTTMPKHYDTARKLFDLCRDAGDIYLGRYEGWYNVREETFVSELEAQKTNFKDPVSGLPLQKQAEDSYFFRLSKYQQQIKEHIKTHDEFIQPEFAKSAILARLEEPLQDLSISRTSFSWGVPILGSEPHVMYVWFDALTNYLSGIDYFIGGAENSGLWPADLHLIGKDIMWFHVVIWPAMLMSAQISLPKTVFAHGFVTDERGYKMSKSIGNIIDPIDILQKYPSDSFRYYLLKEFNVGSDVPFSEIHLCKVHNSELGDALGNLVHRAASLCHKSCKGVIPDVGTEKIFDVQALLTETELAFAAFNPRKAAELAIKCVKETNKYLTDSSPWNSDNQEFKNRTIRTTLEAIYICAHFLSPFIPSAAETIYERLNTKAITLPNLSANFDNLKVGTPVTIGGVLFAKY